MFLGLAVRDLSLFGSTEEPVARLTKESRLWGQELHTCEKKKGKSSRCSKAGWLWQLKTTDPINEPNLTNRGVWVEWRERGVAVSRRCCIYFHLHTLGITLWFVCSFLCFGKQDKRKMQHSVQRYCRVSPLLELSGWRSRKKPWWCSDIQKPHMKWSESIVPGPTAGVTSPLGSFTRSGLSCSSLLCRLFPSWFCGASVPGAELFEVRSPSSGGAVTACWPPTQDSAAGSFSKQTSEENDFLPPLTEGDWQERAVPVSAGGLDGSTAGLESHSDTWTGGVCSHSAVQLSGSTVASTASAATESTWK